MKSTALHKNASGAVGPGPSGAATGSPLHGPGVPGAGGTHSHPTSEEEEASEYTDADESISAPTEFLAEFLSAIMSKDYPTALKYCKLILQYEPNNATAREFYPLIVEKLVQNTIDEAKSDSDDSSSGGSGSPGDTSSSTDEDDESASDLSDDEDQNMNGDRLRRKQPRTNDNDNSSVEFGDTDGTTASYSSLEDEEADPTTATSPLTLQNDNEDAGNGNEVATADAGSTAQDSCSPMSASATARAPPLPLLAPFISSDSESPTEPVSQHLIAELRSRVVAPLNAQGGFRA